MRAPMSCGWASKRDLARPLSSSTSFFMESKRSQASWSCNADTNKEEKRERESRKYTYGKNGEKSSIEWFVIYE